MKQIMPYSSPCLQLYSQYLLIQAVNSIYKAYGTGLITSGNGVSAHAFVEVIQTMEHIAIGNSSCGEHAVITLNQIIKSQDLVHIGNAHLQATL